MWWWKWLSIGNDEGGDEGGYDGGSEYGGGFLECWLGWW